MIGAGRLDATGAAYFDGDSPIGQPVGLRLSEDGQTLLIELADRVIAWQVTDVRSIDDFAGKGDSMLRMRRDPRRAIVHPQPVCPARIASLDTTCPAGRARALGDVGRAQRCARCLCKLLFLCRFSADQLADYIPLKERTRVGRRDVRADQVRFG